MQQQQRRSRAADQRVDLDAVAGEAHALEAVDQTIGVRARPHRVSCGAHLRTLK